MFISPETPPPEVQLFSAEILKRLFIICLEPKIGVRHLAVVRLCYGIQQHRLTMVASACKRMRLHSTFLAVAIWLSWLKPAQIWSTLHGCQLGQTHSTLSSAPTASLISVIRIGRTIQ